MPALTDLLKTQALAGDKSRGREVFKGDRIFQFEVNGSRIEAGVSGNTDDYYVEVDINDAKQKVDVGCECARFAQGYLCKHIWAVLLKFDQQQGHLQSNSVAPKNSKKKTKRGGKATEMPEWERLLAAAQTVSRSMSHNNHSVMQLVQVDKQSRPQCLYVLDVGLSNLELVTLQRSRKKNGDWAAAKPLPLTHDTIDDLTDPLDQEIAQWLVGATPHQLSYGYDYYRREKNIFQVPAATSKSLWGTLQQTGRFYWTIDRSLPIDDFHPVGNLDLDQPFRISIEIVDHPTKKTVSEMHVVLKRGDEVLDNSRVVRIDEESGLGLLTDRLVRIENVSAIMFWESAFRSGTIEIAKSQRQDFLKQLANVPQCGEISFPKSWNVDVANVAEPVPRLMITAPKRGSATSAREMEASVWFVYDETPVRAGSPESSLLDVENNSWLTRNMPFELETVQTLGRYPLGIVYDAGGMQGVDFTFNKRNLIRIVDGLSELGWEIIIETMPVRKAGAFEIQVESDQDWFDLSMKVDFEGQQVALPSLLKALKSKENFVQLADGSRGRMPDEFIKKYAKLAEFGTVVEDSIRFQPTQAMLLDAMLDSSDQVRFGQKFQQIRKKLQNFQGVKPKDAARSFQGELRDYQRDGLGWLNFLREFGFGGCLADDMGLGKTIQVLALLESRRTRRVAKTVDAKASKSKAKPKSKDKKNAPSKFVEFANSQTRKPTIVVVPKSLIFNWIDEASKFTPKLNILNYTGSDRAERAEADEQFDVLLTTYGLLQKDIAELSQIQFDYAILDESQAIKNSKTLCAKASRLLLADHRLAMTGTPIENHLGELWSLFEFLNPGMLGGSAGFARLLNQKKAGERERKAIAKALSKGLQPFILRRTKKQVLKELPEKSEQTLHCEMTPPQKKKYDELKEYYRVKLAKKVETEGIGKSKIQVLEALLRLRQVACDPRLLDPKAKPGAKLELLQKQVAEVVGEGHKVLIFSQFTSLLDLVRKQFDDDGIHYEYLDGKTNNRQERVSRFQDDESISAFLISLKAGGSGLNLTAADYVFLLDPWWNPAVEAQAIDRAHRMGQQRSVMAYRMICSETVEEKIIELQKGKRDLAESIIRSDQSLLKSLTASDLSKLLS